MYVITAYCGGLSILAFVMAVVVDESVPGWVGSLGATMQTLFGVVLLAVGVRLAQARARFVRLAGRPHPAEHHAHARPVRG